MSRLQEIMQRLVDKSQYELQEKERVLCSHLNTLAMVLLGSAGTGRKHRAASSAAGPSTAAASSGAVAANGEVQVADKGKGNAQLGGEEEQPGT